jgi:nucleotide-binding universal stress UspA family protein
MSEIRSPWDPEPSPETEPPRSEIPSSWDPETPRTEPRPTIPPAREGESPTATPAPLHLPPLLSRRPNPWLIVEVDGSPAGQGALAWALREAARREGTAVAVLVLEEPEGDPLSGSGRVHLQARLAAHDRLEAQVLRAIAETGVHGRTRTAVVERPVFEALFAATQGADLVVVSAHGKTLLRQAVARPPAPRRVARGA